MISQSTPSFIFNPDDAIQLPASKSIGARFLMASYFAGTLPADPLFEDSDDLRVLQQVLLNLYADEQPIDYGNTPLDVHASGTAMRFVTAACASTPEADFVVTGTPRVCERPMKPLIELLIKAGAKIQPLGPDGTGPYRVMGEKLPGGEFSIQGDISSQFISALMLCAPSWEKGLLLHFTTPPVSFPYIEMTAKVMEKLGVKALLTREKVSVNSGNYEVPEDFEVEADWSAASFFYEAALLSGKAISIEGLYSPEKSIQGDARCADLFKKLGVESVFSEKGVVIDKTIATKDYIEENLSDNPDLLPPLAVACALSDIKFKFSGLSTLRTKESDRLEAVKKELGRLGYDISVGDDFMEWDGKKHLHLDETIETYDDHRIAMAFAMVAFKKNEIKIKNPDTVDKSFSDFWNQLSKLGLECKREGENMIVRLKK